MMGRAMTMKIGPNDVSGIVWAIGEFSSSSFFGKLINAYIIVVYDVHNWKSSNNENGPYVSFFFFFFLLFWILTNVYSIYIL